MILLQIAIIMIVMVLVAAGILGCLGIWNALLHVGSDGDAGWRSHVATYLGAWVLLAAIGFGFPRYVTTTPDGDLHFSYTKTTTEVPQ